MLIRGGGALGVETSAHEGRQAKPSADARDTGAALLIRGGGALGVETPAHKGWRDETSAHKDGE